MLDQTLSTLADIANAALFLLSEESGQITGQSIIVDGGWTAVSPPPKVWSLEFTNFIR